MISLYESIQGIKKLTPGERERLLKLDKLYGDFCMKFRYDCDQMTLINLDEEYKVFIKYRESDMKYFPQLKRNPCHYTSQHIALGEYLLNEFNKFPCFLSKYYVELIQPMIKKIRFFMGEVSPLWYTTYQAQTPTHDEYQLAMQMLDENPYEDVDESSRLINAEKAKELIQAHIDKRGYKWKVIISDDIIPRMSVNPDKTMYIRSDAKFSNTDISGLKAHEVDGHIGRRYYGLMTGLHLFQFGLIWRNDLDEGLAIYNSLHKVRKVKPNVMFNIALKTIIAYQLDKMDFCELFDFCKKLSPNLPDKTLFTTIARFKREVEDCSIKGGNGDDQSYFCGYQLVKTLTDEQRDDILKWNVGPGQLSDIPDIKRFFGLNKFEPLIK